MQLLQVIESPNRKPTNADMNILYNGRSHYDSLRPTTTRPSAGPTATATGSPNASPTPGRSNTPTTAPTKTKYGTIDESVNWNDILLKFGVLIDRQRQMQRLAGEFYRCRFFWLCFLPAILVTMATSIVSFFFDTSNVVVGILGVVAVFFQGLTKQLDYKSRSDLHLTTAHALQRLVEQLDDFHLLHEEMRDPRTEMFLKKVVREKYDQAMNGVTSASAVPIEIVAAFGLIQAKIDEKTPHKKGDFFEPTEELNIAFEYLFNAFCNAWFFPMFLRRPNTAVLIALKMKTESRNQASGSSAYLEDSAENDLITKLI
jgi:hypothetical protein